MSESGDAMKKAKQVVETVDPDKEAVEGLLKEVISDKKQEPKLRMQAAEVLGRMRDRAWFARPGDAKHGGQEMTEETAKRLCDLAEKLMAVQEHEKTIQYATPAVKSDKEAPRAMTEPAPTPKVPMLSGSPISGRAQSAVIDICSGELAGRVK